MKSLTIHRGKELFKKITSKGNDKEKEATKKNLSD